MSGEAYLTLQGRVGGPVQFKQVNGGHALATFRIGATARAFDRGRGEWSDRPTTWFTVECWRALAHNVSTSVGRGDPVVVHGRLKTTEWTDDGETRSRTVIEALSVGHDLSRGTSAFSRGPAQLPRPGGGEVGGDTAELSPSAEPESLWSGDAEDGRGDSVAIGTVVPLRPDRGDHPTDSPADRSAPVDEATGVAEDRSSEPGKAA